jgi:hypothetical protein
MAGTIRQPHMMGTVKCKNNFGIAICKQIDVNTFLAGIIVGFLVVKRFQGGTPPRAVPFAVTIVTARSVY